MEPIKRKSNKLNILKSEDVYKLVWINDDEIIFSEKYIISFDSENNPTNFNLTEIIEHKKHCCLDIDDENFQVIEEENFNFIIGVNDAINDLRPGSKYQLNGKTFTYWEHDSQPPSWEEISLHIKKMQRDLDSN